MSIFDWILRRGLAGTISRDLMTKYLAMKSLYSTEDDNNLLIRTWNLWLTMNEKAILSENNENKTVRLNIKKEQHGEKTPLDAYTTCKSLFDVYMDVLYIETEISLEDGKLWDRAMRVFLHTAKENGLEYEKEYESYKRFAKCS